MVGLLLPDDDGPNSRRGRYVRPLDTRPDERLEQIWLLLRGNRDVANWRSDVWPLHPRCSDRTRMPWLFLPGKDCADLWRRRDVLTERPRGRDRRGMGRLLLACLDASSERRCGGRIGWLRTRSERQRVRWLLLFR